MIRRILVCLLFVSCPLALLADDSLSAQLLFGRWTKTEQPLRIVLSTRQTPVETIEVELVCGDDVQTATVNIGFDAWTTDLVELPLSIKGELHTVQPFTLHISSAAGNAKLQGAVGIVDNDWSRRLLVEEGTGTWCGNCPRGIVAMRLLKERYPDTFVGMTLHWANSGHNEPMDYHDYGRYMIDNGYITMFPAATLNRQLYDADPYHEILAAYYDIALLDACPARFEIEGEYISDYTGVRLTATTELDAIDPTHDYRIAFACIENDVHQPGNDAYRQFNNYGNNAYGEFYGFEKFPSYIPADSMWYQEVVRFVTAMNGDEGSLPEVPEVRREYTYSVDMPIPATVLNGENCCYIGMLIDATTQEIMNCAEISAQELSHGQEVPLFYDTFRYGLFARDYVRLDLDGNKPFSGMGLSTGDAWGIGQEDDGNFYAYSTSYYSPSGQSNDWLITPATVLSGSLQGKAPQGPSATTEVTLTWRARSSSTKYLDGYEVLVSDGSTDPADFQPFLTIDKEASEWTSHTISIPCTSWATQLMRIAFRNTTKNGERLLIDDLRLEVTATDGIETLTPPHSTHHGFYDLSGRQVNHSQRQKGLLIERSADGRTIKRTIK